jgi:hypothetical protein
MWDFLTSEEGPWWGEAAIAGAFVIVGAALSLVATWLVERSKGKRELARRFDTEIREAGATFLSKADSLLEAANNAEILENRPKDAKGYYERLAEARALVLAAGEETAKALQPLSFVAPDPLTSAAKVYYARLMLGSVTVDGMTDEMKKPLDNLRRAVVDQIRRKINLPPSRIGKRMRWRKLIISWFRDQNKKRVLRGIFIAAIALALLLVGVWIGATRVGDGANSRADVQIVRPS